MHVVDGLDHTTKQTHLDVMSCTTWTWCTCLYVCICVRACMLKKAKSRKRENKRELLGSTVALRCQRWSLRCQRWSRCGCAGERHVESALTQNSDVFLISNDLHGIIPCRLSVKGPTLQSEPVALPLAIAVGSSSTLMPVTHTPANDCIPCRSASP